MMGWTSRYLRAVHTLFFVLLWTSFSVEAQLVAPGKLSKAHADLEGVDECTSCHNFGEKSFRNNCLKCHVEIRSRIEKGLGYHTFTKKLECASCHKEHHGRDFKLIRWDPSKFDHRQSGFELDGKHAGRECRQCHNAKNIVQKEILKKPADVKARTYLGLEPECGNCHDDEHRGQFQRSCNACHNTSDWKKNAFAHSMARFQLVGKHQHVECSGCHPALRDSKTIAGKNEYIKFKGIAFKHCLDCHEDKHHKGAFGNECANCHLPVDWKSVKIGATTMTNFDHAKTHYPLHGKHAAVPCVRCHVGGDFKRFAGKNLERCTTCHVDVHEGQFVHLEGKGDCSSCHTVHGFHPAQFELQRHARSRFPLEGAHTAIPCNRCHVHATIGSKAVVKFHWEDFSCTACHQDPHAGQFASHVEKDGCQSCHSVEDWKSVRFDHNATRFPLIGKHEKTECSSCHKSGDVFGVQTIVFRFEKFGCRECHSDVHQGQFDGVNEKADCSRCHDPGEWKSVRFDHGTSRFLLTGKHLSVQCAGCHKREVIEQGQPAVIRYKPLQISCESCHAKGERN